MFSIPTLLTLARIGLIPVFVVCFYLPYSWSNEATLAIFLIAAFTDWLDGYLARRLNQTSKFGAFLDPVADKMMVAVALVLLVQANPSVWLAIPAAIIIMREIAVSALREWMAEIGESANVGVSMLGKIKTTAQMVAISMLLYHEPLKEFMVYETGLVLMYVAAVLTFWSMILYLKAAQHSFHK